MRTRVYRPEAPRCLEDRSLLSGTAGLSSGPVVFSVSLFNDVINQVQLDFHIYTQTQDGAHLREQLQQNAVLLPFARENGLGGSINIILKVMKKNIANKVTQAVFSASQEVTAVFYADVEAGVKDGKVVVR